MSGINEGRLFQAVLDKFAPGSELRRVWSLTGGISAGMTALEAETADGHIRRFIVRRPDQITIQQVPQAAENEFRLLQVLHPLQIQTPKPYFLDTSRTLFSTPYLIIEYIEGKPVFAPPNAEEYSSQLAEHLARIHRLTPTQANLSFLPPGVGEYAGRAGKPPAPFADSLAEGRIRNALANVWPIPQRNAPVLLHGDYWPGNVLWREGQLAAVIDWEDAQFGDPLLDLAITRLDLLWIFGRDAFQAFTHQYMSESAIDFFHLPAWDLCAALRFIRLAGPDLANWAAFFPPFGRGDITEQAIRNHFRYFVEQALEKMGSE